VMRGKVKNFVLSLHRWQRSDVTANDNVPHLVQKWLSGQKRSGGTSV
jgi:hypothetical protein